MQTWHRTRYWFRFERLSQARVDDLKETGVAPKYREREGAVGTYVAFFDLKEGEDYRWLSSFIGNDIDAADYGIVVSLVTEADTSVLHVPDHIVQLVRELGGYLDFSYTFI